MPGPSGPGDFRNIEGTPNWPGYCQQHEHRLSKRERGFITDMLE
jgi:hypothetical protein